jgi:hypothetical protein
VIGDAMGDLIALTGQTEGHPPTFDVLRRAGVSV